MLARIVPAALAALALTPAAAIAAPACPRVDPATAHQVTRGATITLQLECTGPGPVSYELLYGAGAIVTPDGRVTYTAGADAERYPDVSVIVRDAAGEETVAYAPIRVVDADRRAPRIRLTRAGRLSVDETATIAVTVRRTTTTFRLTAGAVKTLRRAGRAKLTVRATDAAGNTSTLTR